MKDQPVNAYPRHASSREAGFSFIELMVALTITLVIVGLAFNLLARSLNERNRDTTQAAALADANQAISKMSEEIMNSGFALKTNGLVAADCNRNQIHIRANLNAFMKETTSSTVVDENEDVIFQLVANPTSGAALVRTDVATNTSSIVATDLDNIDVDGDGQPDGVVFLYLDDAGNQVSPVNAVRVSISVRITLPAAGRPGSPGYQPSVVKAITSAVVLRNGRLAYY